MSSIVAPSDFTGKFALSIAFNDGTTKIQEYIDVYEQKYMNELLGAACFVDFTTNITNPEYDFILEPFAVDSSRGLIISEGLVTMLKYLIYSHYLAEDLGVSTSIGKITPAVEGGEMQKIEDSNIITFYNQGLKTYRAIRKYILSNKSDYPLFKGIERQLNWFI